MTDQLFPESLEELDQLNLKPEFPALVESKLAHLPIMIA